MRYISAKPNVHVQVAYLKIALLQYCAKSEGPFRKLAEFSLQISEFESILFLIRSLHRRGEGHLFLVRIPSAYA